jgi:hypothetical protein
MTAAAIPAGRPLDAPDDRRRCAPTQGADRAPDPQGATDVPTTFNEQLAAAERSRHARLRRLWQMTAEQRVAAMRRGELTREELAAWSGRHPEQMPMLNGEFEWIAIKTPEVCE